MKYRIDDFMIKYLLTFKYCGDNTHNFVHWWAKDVHGAIIGATKLFGDIFILSCKQTEEINE